jgi:hypothetical protein
LDEWFQFRLYCLPVLKYLKLFSDLVLHSPAMVSVYESQLVRVRIQLGGHDLALPELDTDTTHTVYREILAEEMCSRREYAMSADFTTSNLRLGETFGAKGMFKEALYYDGKALEERNISVLERAVEQTSQHLTQIGKY